MQLITTFEEIPSLQHPCALTIGNFDGVHLGHQTLLQHARHRLPKEGVLAVFTFSNHSSSLFTPHAPLPLICSPAQKIQLLASYGTDLLLYFPFTSSFSELSFDLFLKKLHTQLHFSHLILGVGATLGKNRKGDAENVQKLGKEIGFVVEYIPKLTLQGTPISSGRIRSLILKADFAEIEACLGRPYSLIGTLQGNTLHFPGICLPPPGTYSVHLKTKEGIYSIQAEIFSRESSIHLTLDHLSLQDQECELLFEKSTRSLA